MVTYKELWERVEKLAYFTPNSQFVREYFILCGEAEKILQKLRSVKNLELTEEIELPFIESLVEDLEATMKRLV